MVKGPYQDIKQTIIRPVPIVLYRLKLPVPLYAPYVLELIIAFPRPKLLTDVIFDLTPQKNLSRDYDTPRWQQFRAKSVTWHMARLTVLQDYRENRKPSAPISSDELEIVNTALPDKTAPYAAHQRQLIQTNWR